MPYRTTRNTEMVCDICGATKILFSDGIKSFSTAAEGWLTDHWLAESGNACMCPSCVPQDIFNILKDERISQEVFHRVLVAVAEERKDRK